MAWGIDTTPRRRRAGRWSLAILIVVALGLVSGCGSGGVSRGLNDGLSAGALATPISYAPLTSRDWALLVKAPATYKGNGYQVWGCISQFDAATGTDAFRAQTSYQKETYWFTNCENSIFNGSPTVLAPFVKGDLVFMNVVSLGSFTYKNTIGGGNTAPLFRVDSISNKGSCS